MTDPNLVVVRAGESLVPLADRALFHPARRTLIVADVHLGKGAAFRRAGVAVPSGSTRETLQRLDRLLAQTAAERLLVLGDLFHARLDPGEPTWASFDAFRERQASLDIVAIRGNHDRGLEQLPAHWRIHWPGDTWVEGPLVFAHEPRPDPRGYVLAGHVHPIVRLRARAGSLRLPAFLFGRQVGILPSFGAFTGGQAVVASREDRVIAVTPDGLVALTHEPVRALE